MYRYEFQIIEVISLIIMLPTMFNSGYLIPLVTPYTKTYLKLL